MTKIVNKYGKIIVLEDDIVTSPYFLKFMNEALEFYDNEDKVWHISGWNYPFGHDMIEDDAYLWRLMNCWGWGTWKKRWKHFEKPQKVFFSKDDKKRFNLDGAENFFKQVEWNQSGKINTWAIYWYLSIFKQNGLCLNPTESLTQNIGNDGSGTNCDDDPSHDIVLSTKQMWLFTKILEEKKMYFSEVQNFYRAIKPSLIKRIYWKLFK